MTRDGDSGKGGTQLESGGEEGVGWVKEACSWQREQHRRGPEVRDSIAGPRISHGQAEPGASSGLDLTGPLWVQPKL